MKELRPLHQLDGVEALAAMSAGEVSAAEIATSALKQTASRESAIQAWAYCNPDDVLQQTHKGGTGALSGLLVGVKDNFDTADMPTGYGSRLYEGHRPASDAAAVSLLREQGAVIFGKTVCTEFAAWPASRTRNPRSHAHTPGGSSSGSAAAVADHMVPVALGTQTLGSVIRPASYCGTVGFKPSYGRISRVGVKPLAESLDTVGVLARDVRDADLVYRALSGDQRMVGAAAPRIHICRGLNWELASEDAKAVFEGFVAKLSGSLAMTDWDDPPGFYKLATAARVIHDFELYRGFTFERISAPEKPSPSFREGLKRARRHSTSDYQRATEFGEECRRGFAAEIDNGSVLITLSATGEPPAFEDGTGDPVMNSPWTLLHAPSASVPNCDRWERPPNRLANCRAEVSGC